MATVNGNGKNGTPIAQLASVNRDNGRRGAPKPGCDCVQCFGLCIVEADVAVRYRALPGDRDGKPVFDEGSSRG